jgi:hypothetical protein
MKNWIKKLLGFHRRDGVMPSVATSPAETRSQSQEGSTYSSDEPIRFKRQDRFNRWPFAKRIADTLAARNDPSSIVIGLYGPWGDGKTSTLHMMAAALGSHAHVVVVAFNPWLFRSEEQLLRGFFATLADSIDRSLPTAAEKIGETLKRYGSLLSVVSIPVAPGVDVTPGDAAKGIGQALSEVSIDQLRERVERFLAESGKRVVVLIDDVDRLDRVETHAILKLVKLSAGFKHTSYVLSFDDEMVAAAIGERYAEGGVTAGRAFLEKIIQVPLHLPPPNDGALRVSALEGIEAALRTADIALSQEQADTFTRHFVDGLEPQLRTPRHAKLYANAATFALPLLRGEANPVDLLLVEGIRIFYPKLYKTIRDNPEHFLTRDIGGDRRNDPVRQRANELIDGALEGLADEGKRRIRKRLLEALFPRLSDMGYGDEWDAVWEKDQRICSRHYFDRYFTYSVPPGDVSDLEVGQLLQSLARPGSPEPDEALKSFAERSAIPQLIRKLRVREDSIDPQVARRLAVAIARNGSLMASERGMLTLGGTRTQGAILITNLLQRIPAGEERETLATELVDVTNALPFAWECFRWLRHEDRPEEKRVVSAECESALATRLVLRIRAQDAREPLYATFGRDAQPFYYMWATYGDAAELNERLSGLFGADAAEVDRFLDIYVGEAWGMESGIPRRADFDRHAYNAVSQVIDPSAILDRLRARYGAELDTAEFHQGRDVPIAQRFARQFAYIHRHVLAEQAQAQAAPPAEAGDGEDRRS